MSDNPGIDYRSLPDTNLKILAAEHSSTPIRLAAQAELLAREAAYRAGKEKTAQEAAQRVREDEERRHQELLAAAAKGADKTAWEQLSAPVSVLGMFASLVIGAVGSWAAVRALQPPSAEPASPPQVTTFPEAVASPPPAVLQQSNKAQQQLPAPSHASEAGTLLLPSRETHSKSPTASGSVH
jgi:hypothetical protein